MESKNLLLRYNLARSEIQKEKENTFQARESHAILNMRKDNDTSEVIASVYSISVYRIRQKKLYEAKWYQFKMRQTKYNDTSEVIASAYSISLDDVPSALVRACRS